MEIQRARPIGDLLYEMTLWTLFYPRTLWRVLLRPAQLERAELDGAGEGEERISPPLFLLISILTAHALDLAMRAELDQRVAGLDLNLLGFRLTAFGLFPVVMAVGTLKREGRPVDRHTLRGPFDLQCLYAAPFAISVSVAVVLGGAPATPVRAAGAGLIAAAAAWYLCVQVRWLRARLAVGPLKALGAALRLIALALAACLGLTLLGLRPIP